MILRPHRSSWYYATWAVLGLAAAGCSGNVDDLPRQPVAGTVTLDGRLLPSGMIFFYIRPQDVTASTPQVPAETSINNGRFSIPRRKGPIPANYAIAISSTETPGRRPNPEVGPDKAAAPAKQLIPAKYNTQTELVVEIKQGIKELRIDIDSK